jgi:hypothetical protein
MVQVRSDGVQRDVDDERSITLMKLAKASVARTMPGCPCSADAGVVVAIVQPSGIRTTRPRMSPASGAVVDPEASLRSPRSLMCNGSSPASIRAAISAGPQPGNLVRVAGEQDREPAAAWPRVRTSPGW